MSPSTGGLRRDDEATTPEGWGMDAIGGEGQSMRRRHPTHLEDCAVGWLIAAAEASRQGGGDGRRAVSE